MMRCATILQMQTTDLLGVSTNPIPVKQALAFLGRGTGELRLPMCPPDERGRLAIRRSMARYGLLPAEG